jgi:DNA polymerase-1
MPDFTPDCLWIDGSHYLYRAFHALPSLTTAEGQPTGALFGLLRMLGKLRQRFPTTPYWAVAFDVPGKNFRQQLFADYKAHRPMMPTALQQQIQPLHEVIALLGLPLLAQPGVEADDFIASLTKKAQAAGYKVLIASGDKDLLQLVSPEVQIFDEMHETWFNREKVFEKFGIYPEQMADYLSLVGDKSDNIPGVKGIGEKTACQLLQKYESIENLWQHREELPPRQRRLLEASQADLHLARQLVALAQDLADLPAWPDLRLRTPAAQLVKVLADFGIQDKTLRAFFPDATALKNQATPVVSTPRPQSTLICTWKEWQQWKEKILKNEIVAVDVETTGLDPLAAQLVGVAFAISSEVACYIPLAHQEVTELTLANFLPELKSLLENPRLKKCGHHLKYDLQVLKNYDIELSGVVDDSLLLSYLLASFENRHDLDSLAWRHLRYKTIAYEDVVPDKKATFAAVPLPQAADYAGEDAAIALALRDYFLPRLQAIPSLYQLYQTVELPLLPVLAAMERRGILVNQPLLTALFAEFSQQMDSLAQAIFALAGREFNLNSPKQLQQVLFEDLQLPIIEKTPGGQPSTAENVLQELALTAPIAEKILAYRSVAKLQSTYTQSLVDQCDSHGRLHTQYQQAVTSTGRLSSTAPNLQNIPIRHAEGRRIRQAFVAPQGFLLLAADYSQIELRLMAHFSQDPMLLAAFAANKDIHRATAAEVFALEEEKVSTEQRRAAKAINFGLLYGMSAFGLAKQLAVERAEAQAYIDRYFQRFQGVHNYMQATRQQAAQQGYVETLFGRRLFFPEINSRQAVRRQAAERAAINAPLQGTAADIIKRAMLDLVTPLRETSPNSALLLQVHDELVLEVPEHEVIAVSALVKQVMEQADGGRLSVPLQVQVGVGANWDAAH